MKKSSLPLQVLIILFITFLIREMIYYFSVGGEIDSYFVTDSLFFVVGLIAAFFSLSLFGRLKAQQDLSMISFFLSIKEFKNEIKVLYLSSLISATSFFIYSFLYAISIFEVEELKVIVENLIGVFAIFSLSCFLLFIVCFVFLARKWKRRFEKYGGTF